MTKKLNLQGLRRRETGECTAKISSRVAPHPQVQQGSQTTSSKQVQNYLTFFQAKIWHLTPFSVKFCHMKIEVLCYTACENAKDKNRPEWPALTPFGWFHVARCAVVRSYKSFLLNLGLREPAWPRKSMAKNDNCILPIAAHAPSYVKGHSPPPLSSNILIYLSRTLRLWQSPPKTLKKALAWPPKTRKSKMADKGQKRPL